MREFVRTTWLPTAFFTAASLALVREYIACNPVLAFGPVLTALVVVPAAWHWYVVESGRPRPRRAALAGASSAYVIATLSYVAVSVRFSLTHSWSHLELGALAVGLEDLFVVGGGLLIGAPVGALLGMLIARVQSAQWNGPAGPARGTVEPRSSALTAIMIAILLSPVLALLALDSNQEALGAFGRKYAIGVPAALAATWVVTIPLATVLGARRAMAAMVSQRFWIPAVVLLAPAMAVGSMHGGRWAVCSGVTSVVLVPLIWSGRVSREDRTVSQRGAAAGASICFLAQVIPAVVAMLWLVIIRTATPNSSGAPGGSTDLAVSFSLFTALLATLVGAALGVILARNQAKVDAVPVTAQ